MGTDWHLSIVTKKSSTIKMSGTKVTLYDVQGFYQTSVFDMPVKGTGFMKGNVFEFSMMGTDDYEKDLFWHNAFGGFWDVGSDPDHFNQALLITSTDSTDAYDFDHYFLLEVSCTSVRAPYN